MPSHSIPEPAPLKRTSVLVGRQDELRRLVTLLRLPPSVAVIEGEAGMGKTRLVAELEGHPALDGVPLLVGHCYPLREPFPLGPIIEAVRSAPRLPRATDLPPAVGALGGMIPELADGLPPAACPLGDAPADRHVLFQAMRSVLAALGRIAVVLEDLHWVDDMTTEFARYLVANPPANLALVLTYRPEDVESPASRGTPFAAPSSTTIERIVLQPLSAIDVGVMIASLTDRESVDAGLVQAVYERTGGLPFAVEEMVRLAGDAGLFAPGVAHDPARQLEGVGIPPSVRDAVLRGLDALGPHARRVVEAVSVVGEPSTERRTGRVADLAPSLAAAAVSEAIRAGVLIETGRDLYDLRHAVATRCVYDSIPGPDRRRLHLRAAAELERQSPKPLTRLAHHYREAGDDRRWWRYAEQAADAALASNDAGAAAQLLHGVLSTGQIDGTTKARLSGKLGEAALRAGIASQRDALTTLAETLADPSLEPPARGRLRLLRAQLLGWAGDAAMSYTELVRCLDELERPSRTAVHVMAELATAPHLGMSPRARRRWLDRAVAMAAVVDDPRAHLDIGTARADLLLALGDRRAWDAIAHLLPEGQSAPERMRLALTWLRLAYDCIYLGHYSRARAFLAKVGAVEGGAFSRLRILQQGCDLALRWVLGEWQDLEAAAQEHALATAESPSTFVQGAQIVGLLALARGDVDRAEPALVACADQAAAAGAARALAVSSAGLARIRMRRGDVDAARAGAVGAFDAVTQAGIGLRAAELVPTAVEACLACGRRDEARHLVAVYASMVRGRDAPLAGAQLAVCRGVLAAGMGDNHNAARTFMDAARRLAALPRPYEAARAVAWRGRSLLAMANDAGADMLTEALRRFELLGAVGDAGDVRQLLGGGRAGMPARRRGRRAYGDELSPRERQVEALAARGFTNVEIAHDLGISVRTVEVHVAAVLRKLGLGSKRSLITRARPHTAKGELNLNT
jgi:DNA-binding CsgD family transcriptional regulator